MDTGILDSPEVDRLIELALDEDGIHNDLTTLACGKSAHRKTQATIVAKSPCISAGAPIVNRLLSKSGLADSVIKSILHPEGSYLKQGSPWIVLEGSMFDLLRIERTMLNFLMRMSGIATHAKFLVEKIKHTNCKLLHTRKTVPGHRRTDLYAAQVGGAHSHRRSLADAILVKENHLRVVFSFQDLYDGIEKYRKQAHFVEIEVTDFIELKHALVPKPDRILLDNFSVEEVKKAVDLFGSSVELEASGNITADTICAYAETGVDYVSVGAITHSSKAADLSLLFADHTRHEN